MKQNSLLYLLIIFFIIVNNTLIAQSDSVRINIVIKEIQSLENTPLERTKFISELNHNYLEINAPKFYSFIKSEYDNVDQIKSDTIKFDILHLMEATYYNFSDYDKASIIAYEMLDIAHQTKDSLHYYFAYSSIGADAEVLNGLQKSIEFFVKAKEYAKFDQRILNKANIELGISYLFLKKYSQAKKHLDIAISSAKKGGDTIQLAYGLSVMGEYFYQLKKYEKAIYYFDQFVLINKHSNDLDETNNILNITVSIANIYLAKNNFSKSEEYLTKAYTLAHNTNDKNSLSIIFKNFSKLEEKKGNYDKSLEYYKTHTHYKDSIFTNESSSQINALKIKYEVKNKDIEIAAKNKENEFAKKQIWYMTFISITLISSLIILLLLYKNKLKTARISESLNKEKNKINKIEIENLEQEIELKNKKLADLFLHQYEKAKLINDVIENMDNSNIEIKKMLNNQEEDWKNFKIHFDKVHEGFFDKLNQLSKEFTSKDLRYCAYLRMNITTKEIAIMLCISYRTVQGIRGRVRKKLKLDSNSDLVLYLMNL